MNYIPTVTKYILTMLSFLAVNCMHGQPSFIKFYRFKNVIFQFYGVGIVNGKYIVTGTGPDTLISPPRQTYFISAFDELGVLLEDKYYDSGDSSGYVISTSGPAYMPCLRVTSDSTFIVVFSNSSKNELQLFKYNDDLKLLNKTTVKQQLKNWDVFPKQLEKIDGDLYLAGTEYYPKNGVEESYLFRYDNELNLVWKKYIPGIKSVRSFQYIEDNHEFVFCEFDEGDRYVITDTLLKIKKTIQFADRKPDAYHEHLRRTVDGNYLTSSYNITGTKKNTLNIVKRDTMLNTLWQFSMGPIPGYRATIVDIIPASDGTWLAYGQVGANFVDIHNLEPSLDTVNLNILSTVKFTENGKILWQRFDTLEQKYYRMSDAISGGIAATADGGAIITGDVRCFDTVRVNGVLKPRGSYKHFLMKIDSNGCVAGLHCNVEPKIDTMLSTHTKTLERDEKLTIYPNPTSGMITIDPVPGAEGGQMCVYNAMGVRVEQRKIMVGQGSVLLNFTNYPSGRYDVIITKRDGKIAKGSFVLVK